MNGRRPMMRCGDDVGRGDYEDRATLTTVVAGRLYTSEEVGRPVTKACIC